MKLSFLFLLFFCLLPVACFESPKASSVQEWSQAPEPPPQQAEDRAERFRNAARTLFIPFNRAEASLSSFNQPCRDCPAGIGQVLIAIEEDESDTGRLHTANCQGGLIAENLFITNRHCLPESLREKDVSCEDRIRVLFPQTSEENSPELVECESVIDLSPSYAGLDTNQPQPDWVLLKLKNELSDRIQEFEAIGVPDNLELKAFVPTQLSPTEVKIQEINCTTFQNTLSLPEYRHEESPLLRLHCDQDITPGYSGTLLYQKVDENWVPVATLSHLWEHGVSSDQLIVSQRVVATSLFCLQEDQQDNERCEFDPTKNNSLKEALLIQALNDKKAQVLQSLAPFNSDTSPLRWQELTIEKVEQGQTTPQLLQKWQEMQATLHSTPASFITINAVRALFETLSPLYPECVRTQPTEVSTIIEMPSLALIISRDENSRIVVDSRIVSQQGVEMYLQDTNQNLFSFATSQPVDIPVPARTRNTIWTTRFRHFNVPSLSLCQ
jgi:hypothetical protein